MEKPERIAYKNTFIKENYDRINLTVPKGRKAVIQTHAEQHGESINGFVNRAIEAVMQQEADQ